MPLYTVQCPACRSQDSIFRKIDERDERLPVCCVPMVRIIDAPMVQAEITPYESPEHPGVIIDSRAKQREDLKKAGKMLWEPGIRQDIARNRAREEQKVDALISQRVDDVVRDFAASGRL